MKTKIMFLAMIAALSAGGYITLNSYAAEAAVPAHATLGQGRLLERAKEKLGLTEVQVKQVKAVFQGERKNILALLTRMRDARTELRVAIQEDAASETTVRAAAAKVADVEADAAVERMKVFHELVPILTADQRAKLQEWQAQAGVFFDTVIDLVGERLAK